MNCNYKSIMTKKKAFTLIELLIVIAIIGILFIVLVSKVDFATDKAKATGVQTDFRSFQAAFEMVSKENAGFNTFGWDTGDNAGAAPAGYTYLNANKDKGDRIRNSYDVGDKNLNGIYDKAGENGATVDEVWTGRKVYTENWTGCYTLINPGDASDMSAIFDLQTAINKNLDPKLHINIADDGTISMANGLKDPWSTQYHGRYITNASADAATKWNVDTSMAGSTGDNMDRGAILMYSNGANQKFGTKVKIEKGVVTATVSQIDADHPDNNKMGSDDYVLVVVYTYTNGYGETAAITEGFSNNQQFLTGNGGNVSNVVTPGGNGGTEPDVNEPIPVVPSATFDDGTTLTWEQLQLPENGDKYGYRASVISVTSIGSSAFRSCSSLTSITIPDSVTNIGGSAFSVCTGLTSITVDENNANYKSIDGNLYSKDGKALIQYAIGKKDTSFTIPDSVTSISDCAFESCESLTSIVIPDSVTSICWAAFYGCSRLTSVTIGNGVTFIGDEAFSYCTSLTSITIGNGVTSIGWAAFESCTSLTSITIGNGVTLGLLDFSKFPSLTHVTIGSGVTSIGDGAFRFCSSLTSIVIPDSVTSIGDEAFYGCSSLTSITFNGSMEQWNAVIKGYNWNNVNATYVQCTNGQVTL